MVVTVVVIGAGNRGSGYGKYALEFPDQLRVVAVAEPRKTTRERFQKRHVLAKDQTFVTWEEIAKRPKMADCALVTTQDQMHRDPAVALAAKGYHIFLEKPMAVTYAQCEEIVRVCADNKVMLAVGHVLRYCPQARKIKEIIDSGSIGEVMNIQHLEPVGSRHFAHSYVRGNWHKTADSTFSLLAKCCHDIDLIDYWMRPRKCRTVSSMGSLQHFKPENKPEGASERCLDCVVEAACPYSAKKIYLDAVKRGHTGWPVKVLCEVVDIENVTEALRSGPYGRCVYSGHNDVMDNQVVSLQYEGGATCTMSMVACTEKVCQRQTRIFGSKGELSCDFSSSEIREYDFLSQSVRRHDVRDELRENQTALSGHGGADFFAMRSFVRAVAERDSRLILTGPEESLRSHFLCFEAESARLERRLVDV